MHLIDQGRKKIGIITGPLAWWEARERFIGWQEALQQAGLEPSPSLVFKSDDWSAVNGEQGMRALLSQEPDLDAVFACNDQIALGALGTAHALGRSIPKNLAIVGFDNTPKSAFFWPPLTTVFQQLVDVGCVAVKQLHQMILARRMNTEPGEAVTTVIKPELIIRASSMAYLEEPVFAARGYYPHCHLVSLILLASDRKEVRCTLDELLSSDKLQLT